MSEKPETVCGVQARPPVCRKAQGRSSLQQRRGREGAVQRDAKRNAQREMRRGFRPSPWRDLRR